MIVGVAETLRLITGRAHVLVRGPDWIPDHERRARRRQVRALVRPRVPEPPPILWIRVLPVDPKRLRA
jgi:hypothetical protein